MKITKAYLNELSEKTDLDFDGNEDDPRLHSNGEFYISTIFAHLMSKEEYKQMCEKINDFSIKGKGFEVYTWNDCSSYGYWKEQGEMGDSNYIQISAHITGEVDVTELGRAIEDAFYEFSHYDNWDDFAQWQQEQKGA